MVDQAHDAEPRDSVAALAICKTNYDVFQVLKAICHEHDYKHFMVMRLPGEPDRRISDLAVVTNWDPEFIGAYDSIGFISNSPVVKRLRETTLPLVWNINSFDRNRPDGREDKIVTLFFQFGMISGTYIPVADAHGNRGAVGFSGDRSDPDETELMRLSYLSGHVYERLSSLQQETEHRISDTLTERELDCIYWTAAGKTSGEAATIMGISENTVNHYLSAAATKLGTTNKAHTVAKAIRSGLLDRYQQSPGDGR